MSQRCIGRPSALALACAPAQALIGARCAAYLLLSGRNRGLCTSSKRSWKEEDGSKSSIDERRDGEPLRIDAPGRRRAGHQSSHVQSPVSFEYPGTGVGLTLTARPNSRAGKGMSSFSVLHTVSESINGRTHGRVSRQFTTQLSTSQRGISATRKTLYIQLFRKTSQSHSFARLGDNLSRQGLERVRNHSSTWLASGTHGFRRNGLRCFTTQPTRRQREGTGEDTTPPPSSKPGEENKSKRDDGGPFLASKMLEAAATSLASILVLAIGFGSAGYLYHKFYKHLVLKKMANAFEPGDPVLELAAFGKGINLKSESQPEDNDAIAAAHWIQRPEQAVVDRIVMGQEVGHCKSLGSIEPPFTAPILSCPSLIVTRASRFSPISPQIA